MPGLRYKSVNFGGGTETKPIETNPIEKMPTVNDEPTENTPALTVPALPRRRVQETPIVLGDRRRVTWFLQVPVASLSLSRSRSLARACSLSVRTLQGYLAHKK